MRLLVPSENFGGDVYYGGELQMKPYHLILDLHMYMMMKYVQTESNFRGLTVQILKEATCIVLHRQSGRFAGK